MSTLILALASCTTDLTPSWAFDPIWIEPTDGGGVHGFETWQIYGPKWGKNYNDRNYVCSVVVELDGAATDCDAEPGCTFAWDVIPNPGQSDCGSGLDQNPLFESLGRIAFGSLSADPAAPWPGQTSVTWADYGNGWEIYGNGYPDALDSGIATATTTWAADSEPFLWVPTEAFALTP